MVLGMRIKYTYILPLLVLVAAFFLWAPASAPVTQPKPPDSTKPSEATGTVIASDEVGSEISYNTSVPFRLPATTAMVSEPPASTKSTKKTAKKPPLRPAEFAVIDNVTYPVQTYELFMIPNDPNAIQHWTSSTGLTTAWDTPTGAYQTKMAIIDTGFGLAHEEFTNRWLQNNGEQGATTSENPSSLNCTDRSLPLDANCNLIDDDADGIIDNESGSVPYQNPSRKNCTDQGITLDKSCNRRDDDTNGYVDDVTGWDFINNDNSVQAGELNPDGDGTTHGTMVAGVAAATGNNGRGIAGVDWSVQILPIQALDDDSYGDTLSVGRAIYYAISRGVDVINLSLGSAGQDPYVRGAVEAATKAGILVVAASGNDGCECISYPANYPEVLAVGALDTNNNYATFSSWGNELDIVAPGTNYRTAYWTSGNQTTAYVNGVAGTSFSSPLVAGLATRIKSHRANATPLQLIAALTESTNHLGTTATTILDKRYGFGSTNAAQATARMTTAVHEVQTYQFDPVAVGSYLNPSLPVEKTGSYLIKSCTKPSTPVYELVKNAERFYTISKVEARSARSASYNQSLFGYGCLQQPHDTQDIIRSINLLREFRNIYAKP